MAPATVRRPQVFGRAADAGPGGTSACGLEDLCRHRGCGFSAVGIAGTTVYVSRWLEQKPGPGGVSGTAQGGKDAARSGPGRLLHLRRNGSWPVEGKGNNRPSGGNRAARGPRPGSISAQPPSSPPPPTLAGLDCRSRRQSISKKRALQRIRRALRGALSRRSGAKALRKPRSAPSPPSR